MKARRLVVDGLVIVAGVALFADVYLLPYSQPRPIPKRGKLLTLPASFVWQTNAESVYGTITLTLSNAGPFDVKCQLDWFDFRATNDVARPLPYSIAAGGPILIPSGAVGRLALRGPYTNSPITDQLFCYCVHWNETASWFWRGVAAHPAIDRLVRRISVWPAPRWSSPPPLEEGWAFGSNMGIDEYFRVVHGLNKARWAEEEAREDAQEASAKRRQWATNVLASSHGHPLGPNAGTQKALVDEAESILKTAQRDWHQDLARGEVRREYWHWLRAQQDSAETRAPLKAAPPQR